MFDKILILGGILLGSILVIENMVTGMIGYLFLSTGSNIGVVVLVSIFIGIAIGYGLRGYVSQEKNDEEDYDNYNF